MPSISLLLSRFLYIGVRSSSRQLKALNSWNTTNRVNNTVDSCSDAAPKKLVKCWSINTIEIKIPFTKIRLIMDLEIIFSSLLVGG